MRQGKFKHIVAKHMPTGYELVIKAMAANNGLAEFKRSITIDSNLEERSMLFVFLHECGHVHFQHLRKAEIGRLLVDQEFEADQYAIKAMRAAGVPIPRQILSDHKEVMRENIVAAHAVGETVDDEILRYAYGRTWRKHR